MEIQRRLAESITIHNSFADGLLCALYNLKSILNADASSSFIDAVFSDGTSKTAPLKQDQPRILSDTSSSYQSLFKALLKKFPEVPDLAKVNGYQALQADAKTHETELHPLYTILKDAADFTESAQTLLLALEKVSGLNSDQHFELVRDLFELLKNFVAVQLLVADLGNEKKLISAVYNVIYSQLNGQQEPNYQKICKYINDFDKLYSVIPEILSPIAVFFTSLVQAFHVDYLSFGFVPAEVLRKEPAYNVYLNPKSPICEDKKLRYLPSVNSYALYVVISAFCFPSEFLKQAPLQEILKNAVSNHLTFPLFRSEYFNPIAEFEQLVKANSKISKIKSLISDNIGTGLTKAQSVHSDRRDYLNFLLKQFTHVTSDRPCIIPVKLPIFESILRLATEEVKWYFAHIEKTVLAKSHKSALKSPNLVSNVDLYVVELLERMKSFKSNIVAEKENIALFYSELFTQTYAPTLEKIIADIVSQNSLNASVSTCLSSILEDVSQCSPLSNFTAMRLNYNRLLIHFHSNETNVFTSSLPKFLKIMDEIYWRSLYVDCLEEMIDSNSSLSFLYYYRSILMEHADSILKTQHNLYQSCHVLADIAVEFIKNSHMSYVNEIDRIAKRSAEFVDEFLGLTSQALVNSLEKFCMQKIGLNDQILPESAAKYIPDKRDRKQNKKTQEVLHDPGYESKDIASSQISTIQSVYPNISALCRMFGNQNVITVCNTNFQPQQYLKQIFHVELTRILQISVFQEDLAVSSKEQGDEAPFMVKRPSVYLNGLSSCISDAEHFYGIGTENIALIIKDAILDQINILNCRKQLSDYENQLQSIKGRSKSRKLPAPTDATFLTTYALWYTEIVKEKANSGLQTILPLKKRVTSAPLSTFQTQLYVNYEELCSLCKLVGPNGVKLIGERLLSFCSTSCRELKDIVSVNGEILSSLLNTWHIDGKVEEALKKFKQIDDVVAKMINIGFLLSYRNLIRYCLESVMESNFTLTTSIIKNAHGRYLPNIYGNPQFSMIDNIANFIGIDKNVDVDLKSMLNAHFKNSEPDAKIAANLPLLFALVIRQLALDDKSVYNIKLDAFENNAHIVPFAIQLLLTNIFSLSHPQNVDILQEGHKNFVAMSTSFLLRLRNEKDHGESIKTSFILLQKYLDNGAIVSASSFEDYVPYAIIQKIQSDLYRKTGVSLKIGSGDESEQGQSEMQSL